MSIRAGAIKKEQHAEKQAVPVLAVRDTVHFPHLLNTLHVVRDPSVRAVRRCMESDRLVLVLSQMDMSVEDPQSSDLCRLGTLSEILQAVPLPDTSLRVAMRGLRRVRATRVSSRGGLFWADIAEVEESKTDDLESESLRRLCIESFTRIVQLNPEIPPESLESVIHAEGAGLLADTILHHLPVRPADKQMFLEELDQKTRLDGILRLLKREESVLSMNSDIRQKVEKELGNSQREFFLREQLRIIQAELQEREARVGETEEFRERILAAEMPEEAQQKALAELRRLDRAPAASPEGMVSRSYLETLTSLPWSVVTEDRLDFQNAEKLLDERHFGLEKVKDRVLDFLAVRQLKASLRGPILCFVGPPGVGKTSIGKSIADALGRKFCRISLGGVRDEAEIRGHRRTYIGSMPGRILQSLRDSGSRSPVMVLDEIDKLGQGSQGDPMSALLEALDPEQNCRFSDHYVEIPFDLSAVMFIATANLVEDIPPALLDRMEIIQFSSYTEAEKIEIAKEHLWPGALAAHGLSKESVHLRVDAISTIVRDYTREAGVRDLERQLSALCRKSARRIVDGASIPLEIAADNLQSYLGRARFARNRLEPSDQIGVVWGLVVGAYGGDVVPVEASLVQAASSRPELRLTGNLGEVMRESAQAALTCVQAQFGIRAKDVHIHVPEGGIPKDGPSAGLAIATSLASAWVDRPVRGLLAVTGELTLRGRVLPVGGIRDKLIAAIRAGIREVVIPRDNVPDLEDIPKDARQALQIHPVETIEEALAAALTP